MCKLTMVALGPDSRSLLKQANDIVSKGAQGDIIDNPESFPSS